jgi:hypothetical protein
MRSFIGVLAALVLVSPCLAQSPGPVEKPRIVVGDRWIYQSIDNAQDKMLERSETRVTAVRNDAILTHSTMGGAPRDGHWTLEWNAVVTHGGWKMETQEGVLRFPIAVGSSHAVAYEAEHPVNGYKLRYRGKSEVLGWEEVEVPAGKFLALKVQNSGRYDRLDNTRSGTVAGPYDRAGSKRSSPVQETIWYVPAIKRWAKRTWVDLDINQTEELVRFTVQ